MDAPLFDQSLMEGMLANVGQHVLWQRSERCPCRSLMTGGADPRCLYCHGEGYVWATLGTTTVTESLYRSGTACTLSHPRVTAIVSVVSGAKTYSVNTDYTRLNNVVTWISGHGPSQGMPVSVQYTYQTDYVIGIERALLNNQFSQFGEWNTTDLIATIPARDEQGIALDIFGAGDFDRFVLVDSTIRSSFLGVRGTADRVNSRYVWSIVSAYWLLAGVRKNLVYGTDYTIANGVVTWVDVVPPATDNRPPVGTAYAIQYLTCPEFFVWTTLEQPRAHDRGMMLPKKLALRSFELFGRDKA